MTASASLRRVRITWLLGLCLGIHGLQAGQDPLEQENLSLEKKRLLILPATIEDDAPFSIHQEVTNTVANIAVGLGRFTVIDRNNLRNILAEQDLHLLGIIEDSSVVAMGHIAAAREAMLVTVLNFSQRGVPPETEKAEESDDDEDGLVAIILKGAVKGILSKKFGEEEEKYAHNIQTQLTVEVRVLDIETGASRHTFQVDTDHTGGTAGKSRAAAIRKFRQRASRELRTIYKLNSQVITADGNELILLLGRDLGVRPNMVFSISEPELTETIAGRSITIPGRLVGFAVVQDIAAESNRSVVARRWGPISSGYEAQEHPWRITALQVALQPPVGASYSGLGLQANARAIHSGYWGLGGGIMTLTDSRGDRDTGFNISFWAGKRLFRTPAIVLKGDLAVGLDFPFRADDEDKTTSILVPSFTPLAKAEIFLSAKTDLVLSTGYRFSGQAGSWQRPGEETTEPAVWYGSAPEVNINGFFFTVGLQFYFLNLPTFD